MNPVCSDGTLQYTLLFQRVELRHNESSTTVHAQSTDKSTRGTGRCETPPVSLGLPLSLWCATGLRTSHSKLWVNTTALPHEEPMRTHSHREARAGEVM